MKKTSWALITVMILMGLVFSGCSPAEVGFNDLYREAVNLDVSESSGELTIDLDTLPPNLSNEEDAAKVAVLKDMLNKYAFSFKGRFDYENQVGETIYYLKDRLTGEEKEITVLILTADTIYIKTKGIVDLIKMFGDDELNKQLDVAFEGTEYFALSMEDFNKEIITSGAAFKPGANFFSIVREQQEIMLNSIDDFSQKVYDNYQTGLVKKTNKGYVFSVDPEGAVNCFKSILIYTINNIEKFGACLKDSITALTDDQMIVLGLDPDMRDEFLTGIDPFVANVKENRSNYLGFINEIGEEKEYIDAFRGSKITMSLEKEAPETYESKTLFRVVFQDPVNTDNKLDCSINSQNVMSACEPFDVTLPEQGVITIAELEKRMSQVMIIKTGNGDYTLTHGSESIVGKTKVQMINNQTYLPLREIGEALNESVNWDGETRRAYVERNGRQIDMTGANINSRVFIKIRDFEKLGYQVQWEAETKTVTIIKQNIF